METLRLSASELDELRAIRNAVTAHLPDGFTGRNEVSLMATELVKNALQHAAPPAELRVDLEEGSVRVTVTDHSEALPVLRPLERSTPGGYGLRIVDALSDAWGVARHEGAGKSVWFTLH